MAIRRKKWCQIDLKHLQAIGAIGLVPIGVGAWIFQAQGKPPFQPVCVGIASAQAQQSSPKTLQKKCCRSSKAGQCLEWQQLFPELDRSQPPVLKRLPPSAADLYAPKLDEFGNSIGSEGAAKDAVIQVGVTKVLDVLGPKLSPSNASDRKGHRLNFFQRVRRDYERILGPRELKSGAILTPQIGMGMDLGRFNLDSMNLGVQIKF
jgi:hypothetical protein